MGWRHFDCLREHLLAGALWSAMLAFFLVQGAVSLDLHEAVPRLIFLTVLVVYLGLLEEAGAGRGAPAVRAAVTA